MNCAIVQTHFFQSLCVPIYREHKQPKHVCDIDMLYHHASEIRIHPHYEAIALSFLSLDVIFTNIVNKNT